MAGCLIPHTPIAVDHWKKRDTNAKICFLSHMHGDHTNGLTSSWNQTIYCSDITRSLVMEKFSIDGSLIVAIPIGQSIIIALDDAGVENMTVTLIDANHCAGAVMFLFQGYFGCILHTGDFRYFDGMLNISPFTDSIVINTLYLDNTYCDPQCEFPTRTEATKMVLEIIHNNPDKYVVFGLDNLGKEELLYQVAMDQKVPIVVDEFRKKTADLLGYGSFFTTDPEESYISVKRRREVNKHSVKMWNKNVPTIAILPTCLYVSKGNPFEKTGTIFVVPYSDHSCYSELKNFVAKVKPQRIIPVVNTRSAAADSHDRADMSVFAGEKSFCAVEHTFDVPSTVLAFMSPRKNRSKRLGGRKRKATASYFNGRPKRGKGIVFSPEKRASQNKNEVNEMTVEKGVSEEQQIERETGVEAVRSSSSVLDTSREVKLTKEQNEEIIAAPILPLNSGDQSKEIIDSPMVAVDKDVQNKGASKQGEITPARREAGTKTNGFGNIENGELWPTCTLQKLFSEDKAKIGNEALERILLLTGLKRPNEQVNVCKLRERQDETKDGEALEEYTPQIKDKPQVARFCATQYSKPTENQTTPHLKPPTRSTCSNHNGNSGNETNLKPENISRDKDDIIFSQQKNKQVQACSDLQTSVQVVSTPSQQPADSRRPLNLTPLAQCKTLKGNEPSLNDSNLELGRLSPLNGHLECDNIYPCQPANFSNGQMESRISSTSEVGDIYKDNETRQRLLESKNVFKNSFQSQEKQASGQTSSNEHEVLKGAEAATDRQVTQNEIGNTYQLLEICTCEYDSTEECQTGMSIVAAQTMVVGVKGEKEEATKVSNRQTLKVKVKTEPPFFQEAQLVPLNRTQTYKIEKIDGIQSTDNEDLKPQNFGGFALCECKQEHVDSMRDAESKGSEIIKNNNANAEDSVYLNESGAAMSELQEDNSMPLCGTQTFMEIADEFLSTYTDTSNNKDLSKCSQEHLSTSEKDEYLKSMEHEEGQSHSYTTEIQCQIKLRKLSESQVNECDCVEEQLKLKEHTRVSSTQEGIGAPSEGVITRPIVSVDPDVQSERVNKQCKKIIDSPKVAVYTNVKNEFVSKENEGTIESTKVTIDRDMQCECANRQSEEILDSTMVAVDPGVRNEVVNKRGEVIIDSPTAAVNQDIQKQRVDNHDEELLGSPMVVVDKNVQCELAKMQSKEVIYSPTLVASKQIKETIDLQVVDDSQVIAVDRVVPSQIANKECKETIHSPVVVINKDIHSELVNKQSGEIIDLATVAVVPNVQSELESGEIEETTKSLKVGVDRNKQCECADEENDQRIDSPMLAVDPIVQNKHASKQSNKTKDPPMVAVDPSVQNKHASKQSKKTKDSPMVAVDPIVQNKNASEQSNKTKDSPMVAVDTIVQNKHASKQSNKTKDSPMVAVDPIVQNKRASKQSNKRKDSPMVAVNPIIQNKHASKQSKKTKDSPLVAVDPIVQNKLASKQSKKTKDSPMVEVDSVEQKERASKQSEETPRNKNYKQRGDENMVSNTQKENRAQLRSSDREHTDIPVSNRRKPRRKRIYTGDVTFARNVLENYKREFWNNLLEFGLPDV